MNKKDMLKVVILGALVSWSPFLVAWAPDYIGGTTIDAIFKSLGINEQSPVDDIEITTSQPGIALHNSTHEDTDGGRESIITWRGEQSGGEETTLAKIQGSHDGTSDDQKGDLIFYTNDGSDNNAPTEGMRIDSAQSVRIANQLCLGDDASIGAPGGTDASIQWSNADNQLYFYDKDSPATCYAAGFKGYDKHWMIDGGSLVVGTGQDYTVSHSSDDILIDNNTANKDLIYRVNDSDGGGADQEVMRCEGATRLLVIDQGLRVDAVSTAPAHPTTGVNIYFLIPDNDLIAEDKDGNTVVLADF